MVVTTTLLRFANLFVIFQLAVCTASSSPSTPPSEAPRSTNRYKQFRSDPYEVLGVDPQCAQKDIQRRYRTLCLAHHPDKNRSGDDSKRRNEKAVDDDFAFKEVQHAYSLIGTEQERRKYDLMRTMSYQSSMNGNERDVFSRYGRYNNQFGARANNNMFGPSVIYFTFGDGISFKVSSNMMNDMFQRRRGRNFGETGQGLKPEYVQKVSVPLETLYSGGEDFELILKTSMMERYKAAYNGGVLKPALVQGGIAVLLTWLRSQNVNVFLSLLLFAAMVHVHIPPIPEKASYSTTIKRGWKGGTKIKYQFSDANVVFILQEAKHETFTRVGNNLHTKVYMSAKQMRKGCTLTIKPLRENDELIELKLKPKEVRHGQILTLKSRGWPKGSEEDGEYGDLKVEIRCKG